MTRHDSALFFNHTRYMDTARERWREEQQRQAAFRRPPARRQRVPHPRQLSPPLATPSAPRPPAPREPAPALPDLAQQLAAFQAALPGSRGAAYLQCRFNGQIVLVYRHRWTGIETFHQDGKPL